MTKQAAENLISEFVRLKARLRAERFEAMRRFVSQFAETHRAAHPLPARRPLAERLAAMGGAVAAFETLQDHLRAERRADFSILSVLRVQNNELMHSRLLAWLLNPRGDHNQGALFMSALASLIGLETTFESLRRCHVRTEVTGPEAIIDVVVWRAGDFVIFLENKVWSPEGEEQVDREFRDMGHAAWAMGVPVDRQFAVFLTPSGRRPISGEPSQWVCVSYGEVADSFRGVVPDITDGKVRMIVEDWLQVISDWG